MKYLPILVSGMLLTQGCIKSVIMDPSQNAIAAGDYTLVMSACEGMPGHGGDICRVIEGTPISSVWRIILPTGTLGGELSASFGDITKTYAVKGGLLEIPFKDFFGATTWDGSMDGIILAVGHLQFKNNVGVAQDFWARGMALIVVTKAGYEVLPVDSGYVSSTQTCKVQYSTSGRSAVSCK